MTSPPDPRSFLPLRPVELQILASLTVGARHGYAILQECEERGEGAAVPGLATLYRALRRLEERALIRVSENADEEGEEDPREERRRSYGLTELGGRVLDAELRRLSLLSELARRGLAAGEEG